VRLTEREVTAIRAAVQKHFGADARVVLFGSRADDAKRGGDIDLLVESRLAGGEAERAKLRALSDMQFEIGDQKIDLIPTSSEEDTREVVRYARREGVPL
jgi:predicted nucleotidyltransferase